MFPTKSETYDKVIYQSNHTGTAVFGRQIKIIFPWKVNIKEKKSEMVPPLSFLLISKILLLSYMVETGVKLVYLNIKETILERINYIF